MMTFHQLATQYVAGIDLHQGPLQVCIMDRLGNIIFEETCRRKKQRHLAQWLGPYGRDVTVGVEATYNWYWVADWCLEHELPCVLGHPYYLRKKALGKNKSDTVDARQMATFLRQNEFPVAFRYPAEYRATRDLARRRLVLSALHAGLLQHQSCLQDQYLLEERQEDLLNGPQRAQYKDVWQSLDTDDRLAKFLAEEQRNLVNHLAAQAQQHFPTWFALLIATRGIGNKLAITLLYEIGTLARFVGVQQFSSYCRVVTPQCESSGKRVGYGNSKNGNRYLCWAFHELVETSRRYVPAIQAVFKTLKRQRGLGTAHRVLAHRWAVAIYFMLKHEEPFDLQRFLQPFRGIGCGNEPSIATADAPGARESDALIGRSADPA